MLADLRTWFAERFRSWALSRRQMREGAPLSAREVYLLPTRAGWAALATLIVMWLMAINYNLALGHALVFLLAAVALVSLIEGQHNLVGLLLTVGPASPVFAGETAIFPLTLRAMDGRERRALTLVCGAQRTPIAVVPAAPPTHLSLAVASTRRGWLALPPLVIESRWPLGLARVWAHLQLPAEALVYPRPAVAVPPAPTFAGERTESATGDRGEEDFVGLDRHQPGEPLPRVAWKAAARAEGAPLLAKRFAGGARAAYRLSWSALPAGLEVEDRLSWLARWALDAHAEGAPWSLELPGTQLPLAAGSAHLEQTLTALALYG